MQLGQLDPVWMCQEPKTHNRKTWNSQSSLYVLLLFGSLLLDMVGATNWSFPHISVLILTSNAFLHPMYLTIKAELQTAPFYCPCNQALLRLALWELSTPPSYTQKLGEHLPLKRGHSVHSLNMHLIPLHFRVKSDPLTYLWAQGTWFCSTILFQFQHFFLLITFAGFLAVSGAHNPLFCSLGSCLNSSICADHIFSTTSSDCCPFLISQTYSIISCRFLNPESLWLSFLFTWGSVDFSYLPNRITDPPYLQNEASHLSAVFSTTYSAGPCSHLQTGDCLAWRIGKGLCFSAVYGHVIPVKQCSWRAGSRMGCSYVLPHSAPRVPLSSPRRLLFILQSYHTVITAEARHASRTIPLKKETAHPNRVLWV